MSRNYYDKGVLARYHKYLPVTDQTPFISLNEGSTPLIHSSRLSELTGGDVFIKYEGLNPTGSFKDRGMTVAISKAVESGAKTVLCASTGNTSASAAAYAARAGIRCIVIVPAGKVSTSKLAQAYLYGAKVIAIQGDFDAALNIVRELAHLPDFAIVNSINVNRLEGQKTAAFEIIETLGQAPDIHILPVGNAGNITAYWQGYREFYTQGSSTTLPRMFGIQAAGSAPIFYNNIISKPDTIATAIRIGNPASWKQAVLAVSESHGDVNIVTDEEIILAQQWLASNEGIFVEPASAASVAGLFKLKLQARCIVLTVTGHGLKDPDTAIKAGSYAPIEINSDLKAITDMLSDY